MSALLSLAALAALALPTFQANTDLQKVYATADSNIFISENFAINHGRQEKLTVYPITRAEAEATATQATAAEGGDENDGDGHDGDKAPADPPAPAATTPAAPAAPKPKKTAAPVTA